jgi:hypothetical protein
MPKDEGNEEKKEIARELRRQGISIRKISKQTGLGHGTVERATADIEVSGVIKAKDRLPAAGAVPMTPENEKRFNDNRDLQLDTEKIEREIANRKARRQLAALERAEELELEEKEAELRERQRQMHEKELAAIYASGGQGQDKEGSSSAAFAEKMEALEKERQELIAEKERIKEERHKLQLDSLRDEIGALSVKLDAGRQVGKNQYDLVSEGLSLVGKELNEGRKDIISLLRSPEVMARFNPHRGNPALRAQQGEVVVAALEGLDLVQLQCPRCQEALPVARETLQTFTTLECPLCHTRFPNPVKQAPPPKPGVKK